MKTKFSETDGILSLRFGLSRPAAFTDARLGETVRVRTHGTAEVRREGAAPDEAALRMRLTAAAAAAIPAAAGRSGWSALELDAHRAEIEDEIERALAAEGITANVTLLHFVPDEASRERLGQWEAAHREPLPFDTPMMDGPGAYPTKDVGKWCLRCGRVSPPSAKFCQECGMKLPQE